MIAKWNSLAHVNSIFDHPQDVLRFCVKHPKAALVIVTGVTGGTLRSRGALMAVTHEQVAGYISNGCVDADIILRARAGQSGRFVYGEGSPFQDIILPCGGRIEVVILQNADGLELGTTLAALERRVPALLTFGDVEILIKPRLRIRIAGLGAPFLALADLAKASGFEIALQSPNPDIGPVVQHLRDAFDAPPCEDDGRTAVVILFHDHDWEPSLIIQALKGEAFYVGVMGSPRTHKARRENLLSMGASEEDFERISGPIGLVSAQRNARFLAISILAEIIQSAQLAELL